MKQAIITIANQQARRGQVRYNAEHTAEEVERLVGLWGALWLIAARAYGYAITDPKFQQKGIEAYGWPMAYLLVLSFEMAYGKNIIKSVNKTKSGPVLYTNLLGFPPMIPSLCQDGQ